MVYATFWNNAALIPKGLEAVAFFVAGVRTQPVQGNIYPNNTGPTARLTARR